MSASYYVSWPAANTSKKPATLTAVRGDQIEASLRITYKDAKVTALKDTATTKTYLVESAVTGETVTEELTFVLVHLCDRADHL